MNKFHIKLLVLLLLSTSQVFAGNSLRRFKRTKRSFFSSLFGSDPTTELPPKLLEPIENNVDHPVYLVPNQNDDNVPPSFVPVIPIRYHSTPGGQHFIEVRPLNAGDNGIRNVPTNHWSPVVKKSKPKKPHKKVSSYYTLDLSPTEIAELNQLAKQLGVKDMHDLPPLDEVMILLGTTSKSETIKAVREYASTASGLELIKEYVLSYQPVKRMDNFGNLDNEVVKEDEFDKIEGKSLDFHNQPVYPYPLIGYSQINTLVEIDGSKTTTPAPDVGFFSGLRSWFSFGASTDSPKEATPQNPKLVPHFIIPIRPIQPQDQSNVGNLPLTPYIQDQDPYMMKSQEVDIDDLVSMVVENKSSEAPRMMDDLSKVTGESSNGELKLDDPKRSDVSEEVITTTEKTLALSSNSIQSENKTEKSVSEDPINHL
ncbi:uncharacterized protein LOC129756455 [Uranotaenia lowii]|uniref:uncharacterized protein LOC129756455 n=1 Tax=Uranotaenia lowii TaxID=190385 RepID=UPI00247A7267|nr:uncharacterized protein LOC129756455 [Uranotaenia lowii]